MSRLRGRAVRQRCGPDVLRRVHGADGLWTATLEEKLNAMHVPMGEAFEYDPLRGCKKWNPLTCYTAPTFVSERGRAVRAGSARCGCEDLFVLRGTDRCTVHADNSAHTLLASVLACSTRRRTPELSEKRGAV